MVRIKGIVFDVDECFWMCICMFLTQVLVVNIVLVVGIVIVVVVIARGCFEDVFSLQWMLLFGFVVVSVVLLNSFLLCCCLCLFERFLHMMECVDLFCFGQCVVVFVGVVTEVECLIVDFNCMMVCLEEERCEAGCAVICVQEEERARIVQDFYDEVNQVLIVILLCLQVVVFDVLFGLRFELKEIQMFVIQVMEELLMLACQLRLIVFDDHGFVLVLVSQVVDFGERIGICLIFYCYGVLFEFFDEEQFVFYCVMQESLFNVVQYFGVSIVWVELSSVGRIVLCVRDDGCGFKIVNGNGVVCLRLGVFGMRERVLLVGGCLNVFSVFGEGMIIELIMGAI